jgi:hypothetical protein
LITVESLILKIKKNVSWIFNYPYKFRYNLILLYKPIKKREN